MNSSPRPGRPEHRDRRRLLPIGNRLTTARKTRRSSCRPEQAETPNSQETRTDARKALRRLKRERMKGVQNFVNVHLDRETKKRLKLASFTSEVSMQSLMETAIRKFLDDNGF